MKGIMSELDLNFLDLLNKLELDCQKSSDCIEKKNF